jgi:hypothetical protein
MWMRLRLPGEALIWRGKHEPEVQNAIMAVVRQGDVVYDIGAHVGTMALGAALLVGDSGFVIAFDGDPREIPPASFCLAHRDRWRGVDAGYSLEISLSAS